MLTPEEKISDRFNTIIRLCDKNGRPSHLTYADRAVFYIVSVRCEMDINGFSSVFEQLLTRDELDFLIAALERLSESGLAATFGKARQLLKDVGFMYGESRITDCPLKIIESFDEIERNIRLNDRLWRFDDKLLAIGGADS